MWYPGDEDEEFFNIINKIEKKETQHIKNKSDKQQSSTQLSSLDNSNTNLDKPTTTSTTTTTTTTTIPIITTNTTMSNNERILSTSNGYDIRLPPNSIETPSPSFISSSQDGVYSIDSSSPPDRQPQSPPSNDILNNNNMFFKNDKNESLPDNNNNNNNDNISPNPLKQSDTPVTLSNNQEIIDLNLENLNFKTRSLSTSGGGINSNNSSAETITSNPLMSNIGLKVIDSETEKSIQEGKQVFVNFLKQHTCYDVIPISGKVVVLDTKLAVKSAFYALEENGIKSAPLWNSEQHDFTGMITVSDFIDILLYYYRKPKSNNIFQDMGIHRIETFWREISVERPSSLISTEPETNLYDAASLLLCYKIHRLPVVDKKDTNSILHILTHSRILAFMMKSLPQLPEKLLSIPIGSLGIGTFATVVTVWTHTPLVEVLELLSAKKISAVPIIDSETNKIVDVYSKSDVTLMSKQGILSPSDLNLPVHQVLSTFTKLWQRPEQIYTCTRLDKLNDVIEKCIKKRVHRLVCIDSNKKVEGILSLSDILNYLLNDVKSINH